MRRPDISSMDNAIHMAAAVRRPVRQRETLNAREIGGITDLSRGSGDAHAPTAVLERIDLIDLEGDDRVVERGVQLRPFTGTDEDPVTVDEEIDGQDHRQRANAQCQPSERALRQQAKAIGPVQDLESIVVNGRGHRTTAPTSAADRGTTAASCRVAYPTLPSGRSHPRPTCSASSRGNWWVGRAT